jgi:hypothetical protein
LFSRSAEFSPSGRKKKITLQLPLTTMSLESKMADLMRALKAGGPQPPAAPSAEPTPLPASTATTEAPASASVPDAAVRDDMEELANELLTNLREEARNGRLPAPLPGVPGPDPQLEKLSLQELADRLDSLLP